MKGDITRLDIGAIVNAASVSLGSGGGGIDGAIRSAAGPGLSNELKGKRCDRGQVVVSRGHNLHAKHVFHTVAPHGSTKDGDELMRNCYENCLAQMTRLEVRSIAFCCLGNGIFKFDTTRGAHIALMAARLWLEQQNVEAVDRIVFCTFSDVDYYIYTHFAPHYFPQDGGALENFDGVATSETANTVATEGSSCSPAAESTLAPKLAAVGEAFKKCDIDGNGFIERHELERLFQSIRPNIWTDNWIDAIISAADLDDDNKINYEEFFLWIHAGGEYQDIVLSAAQVEPGL